MRACVLLSGQTRNNKSIYPLIKKNLIDVYNADVFISTWDFIENADCSIDDLTDMYNPISMEVESYNENLKPTLEQLIYNHVSDSSLTHNNPLSVFSMYYKIMRVNRLKKNHEELNGITYDIVIRSRFDLSIDLPLNYIIPANNHIYIPKGYDWEGGYNDLFAIGNSKAMDYYSDVFSNLLPLLNFGHKLHPESLLKAHLDTSGMQIIRPFMDISLRNVKIFKHMVIY